MPVTIDAIEEELQLIIAQETDDGESEGGGDGGEGGGEGGEGGGEGGGGEPAPSEGAPE